MRMRRKEANGNQISGVSTHVPSGRACPPLLPARGELWWGSIAPSLTITLTLLLSIAVAAGAQPFNAQLFDAMRWRLIGPFRAGRVTAVAGIPGDPAIYYMGTPGGGIWKTTDSGRVWKPIFDSKHIASIGALAIAPSNPNIIYAGTGEQTPGNGVYVSHDAGATWTNTGLEDTHFITSILIDPQNPDIVLVGAIGDFAPGKARGAFKSTDGGRTWKQTLYKGKLPGVADLCFDPSDHRVVYATLWGRGYGPIASHTEAAESGIYKSTDEGSTWTLISGHGLPAGNMGRIGIAVARGGERIYAIMNQGLFRSDDAGATWRQMNHDPRVIGNGYFSRVFVNPDHSQIVYVVQTSLYRSTDGGHTFVSFTGAPSGDDFHVLWIDPRNPKRMILGVDQGATISVDGGKTWSSWYNQPTGQFYHVSTSNTFPYYVYAAQQDSGTAAVPSRSDYGEISSHDWFPVGGFEDGTIAADPLYPNIIYSGGWYGSVLRFDRKTGQIQHVFDRGTKYRTAPAAPLVFSPHDPHTLYLGTQYVMKTRDGGMTWQTISTDLTVKNGRKTVSGLGGRFGQPAISTLALSPVARGEIWAGTTNGLIQFTRDGGKTWMDVTPHGIPKHAFINCVEASPHDAGTAYAVATAFAAAKPQPYVFRTDDYGKTWREIINGLPDSVPARVVRADPVRKGLLYAGTQTGVYVSFDDGDHWQSLQLNLPTATVTDLAVHANDLIASTFGRSLWILDDLAPLRQLTDSVADDEAYLFNPEMAIRIHWDNNQDTPLPPEVPAGENPPDGAIIDYELKNVPSGPITLTITDAQGALVRRFSSVFPPAPTSPPNVPGYWFAPPSVLTTRRGLNRFVWNLRYPHPLTLRYSYFGRHLSYTEYTLADHAIPGQTPLYQPQGPFVVPGLYELALTVNGETYRQPLVVRLDPRVKTSQADLIQQLDLAQKIVNGMTTSYRDYHDAGALMAALQKDLANANKRARNQLDRLDREAESIQNGSAGALGFGPINRNLARLETAVESADTAPAQTVEEAVDENWQSLDAALAKWRKMKTQELPAIERSLNINLSENGWKMN